MTLHNRAFHTPADDTTEHLRDAAAIMTLARPDERLKEARAADPTCRRAPRNSKRDGAATATSKADAGLPVPTVRASYAGYTAFALLCVMYEICNGRRELTITQILDALWFRYTDEQMAIIGLEHLRTLKRVAQLTPPPRGLAGDAVSGATARRAFERAVNSEYQRLWQAISFLFEPMDDTPVTTCRGEGKRRSIAEVADAAKNPELAPRTKTKITIANSIVQAGITHFNDQRYPGLSIGDGYLADWRGHLACDETHLAVGLGDLPTGAAPANYIARIHAHSRQYKGRAPATVGLTLAVPANGPEDRRRVPGIVLGLDLHHPTGGLGKAVHKIATSVTDAGIRPTNVTKQYIVVDGGYTKAKDLNRLLQPLKYGLVMRYAKNQRVTWEIAGRTHDDGTHTTGPSLWRGQLVCPGVPLARLAGTFEVPHREDGEEDHEWGKRLAEHRERERELQAFTMRTDGRPQEAEDRQRGGQEKASLDKPTVMKVKVRCPAVAGTARCPIMSDFLDDEVKHLPAVPNAPYAQEESRRPQCCTNQSGLMTLNIPQAEFKTWQDFRPGTWEHEDWYSGPRADNERVNALLKSLHGGAGLRRGAIAPRRASTFALFVALSITAQNRRILRSWDAKTDLQEAPATTTHGKRDERQKAVEKYRLHRLATHANKAKR